MSIEIRILTPETHINVLNTQMTGINFWMTSILISRILLWID